MTAQAAEAEETKTLTEGDIAPDFTTPADDGSTVQLMDLLGKNVVLYFYPKDDTPGCTVEAQDFAAVAPQFEELNTVILGVSKDSLESHGSFKQKYCLPFLLLSDQSGRICESYGVWTEKSMYGKPYMGIERTTFLIDAGGIIRRIWRKVRVENHVQEVLEAIKAFT